MSYLHMFRRNPAITRSDWPFTASLHSSENYATFTRSIHSSFKIKIWSREDHLASGLIEVTYPTLIKFDVQSLSLGLLTLLLPLTC